MQPFVLMLVFATRKLLPAIGKICIENTCLSHKGDYDRVFHTSGRRMAIIGRKAARLLIEKAHGVS